MNAPGANLRFVDAGRLSALGEGELDHALVRGAADAVLGTLTGALIDPLQRRVCFLIVRVGNMLLDYQVCRSFPSKASRQLDRHGIECAS